MSIESALVAELGEKVRKNEPLKNHVKIGVGGVADYYFEADSLSDLAHAVSLSHSLGLPYIVLGDGTNVIPADGGFPGLVIINRSKNIVFGLESSTAIVDSGVNLNKLINLGAGRDLGGLEFLSGVPGSVGGALCSNAGSGKDSLGDRVRSLTMLVPKEGRIAIVKHSPDWMRFAAWSSTIKEWDDKDSRPVILTVTLQLIQRRKDEILRLIQYYLRRHSLLYPAAELSTGDYFLPLTGEEMVETNKIINLLPCRRIKTTTAVLAKENSNCIINRKNATARDIRNLAEEVKKLAEENGTEIKEMVEYIGKWE